MTIDVAALAARANLSLIQWAWQCHVWTGMYLPVPSTGVQLTFLMNSPYDPVFNVCRWRGHFGNGVDRSVPPRAMLYASPSSMVAGSREGRNRVQQAASACEYDLAIGG